MANPEAAAASRPSLVDYFCLLGVSEEDKGLLGTGVENQLQGRIISRYPQEDRAHTAFPEELQQFAFPNGVELLVARQAPQPASHPFVLTQQDGTKLFCSALVFWEQVSQYVQRNQANLRFAARRPTAPGNNPSNSSSSLLRPGVSVHDSLRNFVGSAGDDPDPDADADETSEASDAESAESAESEDQRSRPGSGDTPDGVPGHPQPSQPPPLPTTSSSSSDEETEEAHTLPRSRQTSLPPPPRRARLSSQADRSDHSGAAPDTREDQPGPPEGSSASPAVSASRNHSLPPPPPSRSATSGLPSFLPRALVLVSHFPFFAQFERFLHQLYTATLTRDWTVPVERLIANFVGETPVPPRGLFEVVYAGLDEDNPLVFSRPPPNQLDVMDFSLVPLFESLPLSIVVALFEFVLAEKRICFTSDDLSKLVYTCEAFLSFLFPLHWKNVYIPLLPRSMCQIVAAPMPYIVGIPKSYLPSNQDLRGVIIVDLDTGSVSVPASEQHNSQPWLANSERRQATLLKILRKAVPTDVNDLFSSGAASSGGPPAQLRADLVRQAFLGSMTELLADYRRHLGLPEPLLDPLDPAAAPGSLASPAEASGDRQLPFRDLAALWGESQSLQNFLDDRARLGEEDLGVEPAGDQVERPPVSQALKFEVMFFDELVRKNARLPAPFLEDCGFEHCPGLRFRVAGPSTHSSSPAPHSASQVPRSGSHLSLRASASTASGLSSVVSSPSSAAASSSLAASTPASASASSTASSAASPSSSASAAPTPSPANEHKFRYKQFPSRLNPQLLQRPGPPNSGSIAAGLATAASSASGASTTVAAALPLAAGSSIPSRLAWYSEFDLDPFYSGLPETDAAEAARSASVDARGPSESPEQSLLSPASMRDNARRFQRLLDTEVNPEAGVTLWQLGLRYFNARRAMTLRLDVLRARTLAELAVARNMQQHVLGARQALAQQRQLWLNVFQSTGTTSVTTAGGQGTPWGAPASAVGSSAGSATRGLELSVTMTTANGRPSTVLHLLPQAQQQHQQGAAGHRRRRSSLTFVGVSGPAIPAGSGSAPGHTGVTHMTSASQRMIRGALEEQVWMDGLRRVGEGYSQALLTMERTVCNKNMDTAISELSELDQAIQAEFQRAGRLDGRLAECRAQLQSAQQNSAKAERAYLQFRERAHGTGGAASLRDLPWSPPSQGFIGVTPVVLQPLSQHSQHPQAQPQLPPSAPGGSTIHKLLNLQMEAEEARLRLEQAALLFCRLFADFQSTMPQILSEVSQLSRRRRLCMRRIARMLAESQLHCAVEWRSELRTWMDQMDADEAGFDPQRNRRASQTAPPVSSSSVAAGETLPGAATASVAPADSPSSEAVSSSTAPGDEEHKESEAGGRPRRETCAGLSNATSVDLDAAVLDQKADIGTPGDSGAVMGPPAARTAGSAASATAGHTDNVRSGAGSQSSESQRLRERCVARVQTQLTEDSPADHFSWCWGLKLGQPGFSAAVNQLLSSYTVAKVVSEALLDWGQGQQAMAQRLWAATLAYTQTTLGAQLEPVRAHVSDHSLIPALVFRVRTPGRAGDLREEAKVPHSDTESRLGDRRTLEALAGALGTQAQAQGLFARLVEHLAVAERIVKGEMKHFSKLCENQRTSHDRSLAAITEQLQRFAERKATLDLKLQEMMQSQSFEFWTPAMEQSALGQLRRELEEADNAFNLAQERYRDDVVTRDIFMGRALNLMEHKELLAGRALLSVAQALVAQLWHSLQAQNWSVQRLGAASRDSVPEQSTLDWIEAEVVPRLPTPAPSAAVSRRTSAAPLPSVSAVGVPSAPVPVAGGVAGVPMAAPVSAGEVATAGAAANRAATPPASLPVPIAAPVAVEVCEPKSLEPVLQHWGSTLPVSCLAPLVRRSEASLVSLRALQQLLDDFAAAVDCCGNKATALVQQASSAAPASGWHSPSSAQGAGASGVGGTGGGNAASGVSGAQQTQAQAAPDLSSLSHYPSVVRICRSLNGLLRCQSLSSLDLASRVRRLVQAVLSPVLQSLQTTLRQRQKAFTDADREFHKQTTALARAQEEHQRALQQMEAAQERLEQARRQEQGEDAAAASAGRKLFARKTELQRAESAVAAAQKEFSKRHQRLQDEQALHNQAEANLRQAFRAAFIDLARLDIQRLSAVKQIGNDVRDMYLSHDTSIMAALKQLQSSVLAADLRLDMVQVMARAKNPRQPLWVEEDRMRVLQPQPRDLRPPRLLPCSTTAPPQLGPVVWNAPKAIPSPPAARGQAAGPAMQLHRHYMEQQRLRSDSALLPPVVPTSATPSETPSDSTPPQNEDARALPPFQQPDERRKRSFDFGITFDKAIPANSPDFAITPQQPKP